MKRYDIYFARLDPVEGSEIGKTRPCVIISDDKRNQYLNTVVVCPLTSKLHPAWKTRIPVFCDGKDAEICVDQIRVLSKLRLTKKIDALDDATAEALRKLIKEMYADL